MRRFLVTLLLAGCGGGGGGSATLAAIEQAVVFGIVRADAPTTVDVPVTNPFDSDATVEEVGGAGGGPFAPEAGALPAAVAAGLDLSLPVVVTPTAVGPHAGEIRLKFTAGGKEREVVLLLEASAEKPTLTLLTPSLSFSVPEVGEQQSIDVRMRNNSQKTPIAVTSMSALPLPFSAPFQPVTLLPGELLTVTVTYQPTAAGSADFLLSFANTAGTSQHVHVTAATAAWPAQQITDFGSVPLTNGRTGWLEVSVPPDAISFSIEAIAASPSVSPGLLGFEGPGGKVYENDTATGAFLWTPGTDGVFASTLPNSDRSDVQLVPGGGIYRFRVYTFSGSASSLSVRAIVENRPGAVAGASLLNLNVFLAPALAIADPANDTRLQSILSRLDDILAQVGLHLGSVSYYQLSDSAYNSVSDSEFPLLLAESGMASAVRANLFFVQTALGGGTLGVAAEVPGPMLNGMRVSGVMVDYDWAGEAAVGQVAAHELGHYLGLFHTAESDGFSFDIIDDTLECPAECSSASGGYLMHWQYAGATMPVITLGEAHVILGHPLVKPDPALSSLSALAQKSAPAPVYVELPPNFCGTCIKHK